MKALRELYSATNGDHWRWPESKHEQHWNESDNVCQWFGISCQYPESGIATVINLMARDLDGEMNWNILGGTTTT